MKKEPANVKAWLAKYNGIFRLFPAGTAEYVYGFADQRMLCISTVPTTTNDARGRRLKSDGKTLGEEEERIFLVGGPSGIDPSIRGAYGGYNRFAKIVVDLLYQAKKISETDYATWSVWYDEHVTKTQAEAKIEEMHRLAEAHGFVVTKKPSTRKRS